MGTLVNGIKEIFATAKTTGSNVLLCGNDGTPDGHMTMANLASVLGALTYKGEITNVSVNTITNNGIYRLSSEGSVTNLPENGYFTLVVYNAGGWIFQIAYRVGTNKVFNRTAYGSDSISSAPWLRVYDEGILNDSTILSSLANALGVTKRMEFVDLGLPSGTLWATRNLGAETPEDYGYYFSWGNVIGRKPNGTTFDYDWGGNNDGNYASTPGAALTGDIPTNMDYDAVQRYMGGSCKMPEKNQFVELFNSSYTTNGWTTKNGVNGRLVTSKINSNSIFFPAAGYGYGTSLNDAGSYGYYWSRSLDSSASGYGLNFSSSYVAPQNDNSRYIGFSVRAVL